jgi:predicted HAD superfamily Cof-like phosphohydrolase
MIWMIDRICKWNEARYSQHYNHKLTDQLLREELDELFEAYKAKDKVEMVDGLVDIIYVAVGALWKMGLDAEAIHAAISIVCDSNDTKTVERVSSDTKANLNKGNDFIPPTEALKKLLHKKGIK